MNCRHVLLVAATAGLLLLQDGSASAQGASPAAPALKPFPFVSPLFGDDMVLQRGKIDRAIFTDNANSYFTDTVLKDFAASLAPLGTPLGFTQTEHEARGGMDFRRYTVKFSRQAVDIWMRTMPDGRIEQYQIMAKY